MQGDVGVRTAAGGASDHPGKLVYRLEVLPKHPMLREVPTQLHLLKKIRLALKIPIDVTSIPIHSLIARADRTREFSSLAPIRFVAFFSSPPSSDLKRIAHPLALITAKWRRERDSDRATV